MYDTNQKFKDAFQKAKVRYKELQYVDIELKFSKSWFFTMRASVELNSIFNKKRKYYICVNLRRKDVLPQLTEEDLIGWFGHELSHIIEYETMPNSEFLLFVIKYIFNLKFRFSVEKRVNVFTYNNGFAEELFGLRQKFISLETINKKYKNYILKNYHPEWEDVQIVAEANGISKEDYESYK